VQLRDSADASEVGVLQAATVVRDNYILVYAYIGEQIGFGVSNPHTEVWRLELSADRSSATQETVPSNTEPAGADDGVASPDESAEVEWNPILATTKAASAPTAATCGEGANPNVLGPIDQARPWGASWSNQAAVFDQHAGRLVFLDEAGETWTFDVCANTWQAMNPTFDSSGLFRDGWSGQLVYDVDSDLTISFRQLTHPPTDTAGKRHVGDRCHGNVTDRLETEDSAHQKSLPGTGSPCSGGGDSNSQQTD
jgi:hypothetical protein